MPNADVGRLIDTYSKKWKQNSPVASAALDAQPSTASPEPDAALFAAAPDISPTDLEDPVASRLQLSLPMESAAQSPEPDDHYLRDGPHPLGLLSDLGSRLRDKEWNEDDADLNSDDWPQTGHDRSNNATSPAVIIAPGWTRSQLQQAALQKRQYFRYGSMAIKRDVAPNLDPITIGLVNETTAEKLIQGWATAYR